MSTLLWFINGIIVGGFVAWHLGYGAALRWARGANEPTLLSRADADVVTDQGEK